VTLQSGTRLGPYEILSAIGAGGMGEVWKARDTRLGRIVAIKRLTNPDRDRFDTEARAIAALNHPHICQVYDVGPDYLVLEYIEGHAIRGPLAADEALRLAMQIAGALEAAHSKGILHRDLKPANIMVTEGGSAKLLDFGLAKLMDADADVTRTVDGTVLGTPAYLSPEQAEGKPLDARSDIFSFGAVMYEMLSGTRAFPGTTTVQVWNAILRDGPPPLQAFPALERIVRRCLAKQASQRFQTMTDVRLALEQAAREVSSPSREQHASIAVLPFADMSEARDQEWFSDGLAEEIINALAHIRDLKVIARTSAFAFKGKQEDIRRIAEVLGVAHVLEGSVRKAGNRIRVTAQLITAADGSHLWSERYDRELTDIFAIQDDIGRAIAAALQITLSGKVGAHRQHTPNLPAYEAFLRGRHHLFKFTPESWTRGTECLAQAIALDPAWAQPHAELGLAHLLTAANELRPMPDVVHLIRDEAQKALNLDPSDPAPHALLGCVAAIYDYDWSEAGERFRRAMTTTPVGPDVPWAYTSFYLSPLGRFQEGVTEMRREVERDPLNVSWRSVLSASLNYAEMYDDAIQNARKAIEIDENHWLPYLMLSQTYAYTGRFAEAIAAAEYAHRVAPWHSMPIGVLAGALACVGEQGRARELVRDLGDRPVPIWGRVEYHLLCSEIDAAADWYEKMIDVRAPLAVLYAAIPIGKALRQSVRWPKLAGMMNLPVSDAGAVAPARRM
jgi:TolB-like protein/tRNA A-37 threonylcarbamoyl transferase component Bud32